MNLMLSEVLKSILVIVTWNVNGCSLLQAREKFLSLRKSTRMDIAQATEEVYPIVVML